MRFVWLRRDSMNIQDIPRGRFKEILKQPFARVTEIDYRELL
jgi:hypothetical protein